MIAKEQLWLACAEKRCCRETIVYPSGADVYRIATALVVPPWDFTIALPAEERAADGFALDRSPRRYRVALAKKKLRADDQACTFLIFALDGAARCGLGDARPGPCHSFPSYLENGELKLIEGVCSCRRWAIEDVDLVREKALLLDQARERATYQNVIDNWNAFVARDDTEGPYEYPDFCRYLLDAYGQLKHASV